MVNWMLAAIKCIGVGWILLTFLLFCVATLALLMAVKTHSLRCLVLRLPGYLSELYL